MGLGEDRVAFRAVTRVVNQEACQLDEAAHQLAVAVASSLRYSSNQLAEMADACAFFPRLEDMPKIYGKEKDTLSTASTADPTKWNSLDT